MINFKDGASYLWKLNLRRKKIKQNRNIRDYKIPCDDDCFGSFRDWFENEDYENKHTNVFCKSILDNDKEEKCCVDVGVEEALFREREK